MRTSRLILFAVAIQFAVFAMCGCAARDGSPVRVDAAGLADGLWRDLAAAKDDGARHDLLAREVVAFAGTSDRVVATREELIAVAMHAAAVEDGGRPIPAADVEALNRTFAAAMDAVREAATVAARHDVWRKADADACAAHGLPPLPQPLRVEGAALCAAAALLLYDDYLAAGVAVAHHPGVRRVVNRGDSGYGVRRDQIDGLTNDYLSLTRRARVHDGIAYIEASGAVWDRPTEPHLAWLRERITTSASWATLRSSWLVPVGEFANEIDILFTSDTQRIGEGSMNTASQGFGNAVGAVAFRKGLLYGDPAIEARIRAQLRPGDIVLEKTPFRLTDRFIPGHWGHAAIWVGGEADLRAIGMWEDPLVKAHAAELAAGRGMCEALRDGVQLNALAHFLDIDDICVLRKPGLEGAELAEHIRRALRQLGKEYDFNFDVETADRIVCSELVYQVYTGMSWPTGQALGRWTISPDQVAVRAIDGGPLAVVELWHDGKPMEGDRAAELAKLLRAAK